MKNLLIVSNARKWSLNIPNTQVLSGREYLTDTQWSALHGVRVFNLMHQHSYQGLGYYVSLLAEARGHKPVPNITMLRDLQTPAMIRMTSADLQELIDKSLRQIKTDTFTLSIYFGKNLAKRYDKLCREIFNRFHAHFLRAYFKRSRGKWSLQNICTIGMNDVPQSHYAFIEKTASVYFARGGYRSRKRTLLPYSLAMLHRPDEVDAPSNAQALKKFIRAGQKVGIDVQLITRQDFGRLNEFDALFIRETTSVNNHTFRFARYAQAEGLVVIDDPQSIIRCANKVFLAELAGRYHLRTPRTMILHKDNMRQAVGQLKLPCVLKQPDSAFSAGIQKIDTAEQLHEQAAMMLKRSELIIAQEFLPTDFDWRIGVLDHRPLYACRYYMVKNHWQIIQRDKSGRKKEGNFDTLTVEQVPADVLAMAMKITRPIGNGFYGVDIKQVNNRCYFIEVNDNPNVDAGVEDAVLKNQLYLDVMHVFRQRLDARNNGHAERRGKA